MKKLDLQGNFFYNNTAKTLTDDGIVVIHGDGGAIYNSCPVDTDDDCKSTYINNTFESNHADHDGGAIKWTGWEPYNITSNNTYGVNNTAAYGPNYAATAIGLVAITREEYDAGNVDDTSNTRLRREDSSMTSVASGQKEGYEMVLVLRDKYGQAVLTDTSSTATLVSEGGVSLGGTTTMVASNGVYLFNDFSVTASPGTSGTFRISTDGIVEADVGASTNIDIDVEMRT